jgi:hypothetical protein
MRVCVYTAIYGGYDDVHPPAPQSVPTDFFCYTDAAPAAYGLWRTIRDRRLPDLHPRTRAKWFKTHPHVLFPRGRPPLAALDPRFLWRRYDATIWIDGSIRVTSKDFARDLAGCLGPDGIACFRHPQRDCIYEEAEKSLRWAKYRSLPIREQVEHYRREGFPAHRGLMAGGVIVRATRAPHLPEIDEAWWQENLRWTWQDQLSLPVVLWRQNRKIAWIPGDLWKNPWFEWVPHRREEGLATPTRPAWSADAHAHCADAFDRSLQHIAAPHRRHTFRRAGKNQVARRQPHEAGKIGNGLRHAPDHVRQIRRLPDRPVDFQLDLSVRRVRKFCGRHDVPDRRGTIEPLAHVPGPALVFRLVL